MEREKAEIMEALKNPENYELLPEIEDISIYTEKDLLERKTISLVFDTEIPNLQRQEYKIALLNRAKVLKVEKDLKDMLKAYEKDIQEEIYKELKPGIIEFSDEQIKDLNYKCGSFFANNKGVFTLGITGRQIMACYTPIYPAYVLKNIESGKEKVIVRYQKQKDGPWLELCVDKSVLSNHRQIVKLAEYGILVNSVGAKSLVEYMTAVEAFNPIPTKRSTSRFGWYQIPSKAEDKADLDNVFVPYCQDIQIENQGAAYRVNEAITSKGEPLYWLRLFGKLLNNKDHFEPQFMVAASLASVLLKPLNLQPFIVNIWGTTGKGKSLTLMLAASVWGDPTGNKYITEADNTRNALVKKCGTLNHLPLCIDDFSKVTRKLTDSEDLIYSLCSGSEKERLDRDAELKTSTTWQNAILTTNESPLAKDYMRGGAINRVLDIEMNSNEVFENPAEVVDILSNNFGWIGPRFISFIKTIGFDEIKQRQQEFRSELESLARKDGSVKENKQLLPLSIILTADYYLSELYKAEFKPLEDFGNYSKLPINYLLSQLKGIEQVSDGQRAYEDINAFVSANPSKFVDLDKNQLGTSSFEIWGYLKAGYVYFNNLKFREFMRANNHDVTAFCTWAKSKKDYIHCNYKNQYRIRVNGACMTCYAIKLIEQGDNKIEDLTSKCPFNE